MICNIWCTNDVLFVIVAAPFALSDSISVGSLWRRRCTLLLTLGSAADERARRENLNRRICCGCRIGAQQGGRRFEERFLLLRERLRSSSCSLGAPNGFCVQKRLVVGSGIGETRGLIPHCGRVGQNRLEGSTVRTIRLRKAPQRRERREAGHFNNRRHRCDGADDAGAGCSARFVQNNPSSLLGSLPERGLADARGGRWGRYVC